MSIKISPMRVVRVSCYYNYETPTRKLITWELIFQNISGMPAKYVIVEANSYLPMLRISDSTNRELNVIPRHMLPKEIKRTEYTMLIELKEPLKENALETIRIKAISTLGKDSKISHESYLIGYTHYPFSPEISPPLTEECSWYIGIFAPEGYVLEVSMKNEGVHEYIYQDERSYIFRSFSKKPPEIEWFIKIPKRVNMWLITGLCLALIIPFFALLIFCYTLNPTISFSMIIGTIAAIIAMRAWIFYSVELLDRMNILYLFSFIYSLVIAGVLLFIITYTSLLN